MRLTYIEPSGAEHPREAEDGQSVMEVAVSSGVPGILGDCGGACSCATCHVYVDPAWMERIPEITDFESDMLDIVDDRRPNSRLGCQIRLEADQDGLVVHLPDAFL